MSLNQLLQVRALELPSREAMLNRDRSVQHFWDSNRDLLSGAWREWEENEKERLIILDDALLDANLRDAVAQAWEDPATESSVRDLWQEVSPGVFLSQFFDPERLADLRNYLDVVSSAKIPLRPPYGIVLNSGGAMLDPRSEGFLAAPGFQAFYRELLDNYMRPIGRLLFPEVMGYDTQTFGFSIKYQAGGDSSLRLHTDASAVTLNINLNLPGEAFAGSAVDFLDPVTGRMNRQVFKPGSAIIHRGNVAHATQPITDGERTNLVMWLYGDHGQIPFYGTPSLATDARQRWTVQPAEYDDFAPF